LLTLAVALLWAATPAVACFLPSPELTAAEKECCHQMGGECGNSAMPSSHSCCKAPAQHDTVVTQAVGFSLLRHGALALSPSTVSLVSFSAETPLSRISFIHAPPPEPSPGSSPILRI
jgi:hypothetical protein